jgi:hypothetical protein
LIEPHVGPQEGILRKVFCQFDIGHKTKNNPDQPALVSLHQSAEGVTVSAPRFLDEPGVADSSRILLRAARKKFRVRHEFPAGPTFLGSHS